MLMLFYFCLQFLTVSSQKRAAPSSGERPNNASVPSSGLLCVLPPSRRRTGNLTFCVHFTFREDRRLFKVHVSVFPLTSWTGDPTSARISTRGRLRHLIFWLKSVTAGEGRGFKTPLNIIVILVNRFSFTWMDAGATVESDMTKTWWYFENPH